MIMFELTEELKRKYADEIEDMEKFNSSNDVNISIENTIFYWEWEEFNKFIAADIATEIKIYADRFDYVPVYYIAEDTIYLDKINPTIPVIKLCNEDNRVTICRAIVILNESSSIKITKHKKFKEIVNIVSRAPRIWANINIPTGLPYQ